MNTDQIIHFAPLQGYTDNEYRETFDYVFGNIDYFYSPYISVENDGRIKSSLNSTSNHAKKLVPQVLPGNMDELKLLSAFVIDKGFSFININLGCPYPMVFRKGRGSALIRSPKLVNEFLNYLSNETSLQVSLKIRSGMEDETEIIDFLTEINFKNTERIIIHPRTSKQLYKGVANISVYKNCLDHFPDAKLIYNGDIKSYTDFVELASIFPLQKEWMIGRGLLKNPFLSWQIKNDSEVLPENHTVLLHAFCSKLFEAIISSSNDEGHALNRVKIQLSYLFEEVDDKKKWIKLLKKAKSLTDIRKLIALLI